MMSTSPGKLWLTEPSVPDDTYARRGEHPLDWLARSTVSRAQQCRHFLNSNIASIPPNAQALIIEALRNRWDSAFFELIVARCLQELGASIEVESSNADNRHPDFTAQFEDGNVIVEAVSPVINAEAGEQARWRNPLLNIIEAHAPAGWRVHVWELPHIGLAESKRQFKQTIAQMLSLPPPQEGDTERQLSEELPQGNVRLHLWPVAPVTRQLGLEPPFTVIDNSEDRIRYAVRQKRRQVRSSDAPVLLAVHASGLVSEYEDFDKALFGHTFGRVDTHGNVIEQGFDVDGEFTYNLTKVSPPTYAGVLAFLEVGFLRISEPVLYRHPRFTGILPEVLLRLEQRFYAPQANEIRREQAKMVNFLRGLHLVQRDN